MNIFAFGLALAIHGLLFFILYFSVQWRSQSFYGIEAEIWTTLPSLEISQSTTTVSLPIEHLQQEHDIAIATRDKFKQLRDKQKSRLASASENNKSQKNAVSLENRAHVQRLQKLKVEQDRAAQLARLRQVATESGNTGIQGTGSGMGDIEVTHYIEKVKNRVRPNIFFDIDSIIGNPTAVVEVELAPDGLLLNKRLIKSSGNIAWDTEVLSALERSSPLPRDKNGKAPPNFTITFRPRD